MAWCPARGGKVRAQSEHVTAGQCRRLIDVVVDSAAVANPDWIFRGPFANLTPLYTRFGSSQLKQKRVYTSSLNPPACTSASNASRIRSSAISRTMETKNPFSLGVDLS